MSRLIKVLKPEQSLQIANSVVKNIGAKKAKLMIDGTDKIIHTSIKQWTKEEIDALIKGEET